MSLANDDEPLTRLVYVSTLTAGTTASDVDDIVARSATWNTSVGVTGILAVDGNTVCQILEGPTARIGELFDHIKRDKRHFGVTELLTQPIDMRHFGEWGMVRRRMVDVVTLAFTL